MKKQLVALACFCCLAPVLFGGCYSSLVSWFFRYFKAPVVVSSRLAGTSGELKGWFGGTKPRVEEAQTNRATFQAAFVDEHHEDGSAYRGRTEVAAPNLNTADFKGVAILQYPEGLTVWTGSYNDYQGHTAALSIPHALTSLPLVGMRVLTAEPGQLFAVVRVPDDLVPDFGSPEKWYEATINFVRAEGQTGPVVIKGIIAATLESGGQTYYFPLCPAVTDMAAVPSITLPESFTEVQIPLPSAMTVPPPGGTAVYDVTAGTVSRVLYFPRLAFQPGVTDEGYGFVNVGAQPDQVEFKAFGAGGEAVGASSTIAWPAGGQGAYQADAIFGLSGQTGAWVTATAGGTGMRGFFLSELFSPVGIAGLDGAPVFTETFNEGYIPRVQGTGGYTTQVMTANPDHAPVDVTFSGLSETGPVAGPTVTIPALGVHIADLATLFGAKAPFDGALKIAASGGVIASANIRYGQAAVASVNAVPREEARRTWYASHAVAVAGYFSSRLHLVNPAAVDRPVTITAYGENGVALGPPTSLTIGSNRTLTLDEAQMGLPPGNSVNGWLKIETSSIGPEAGFLGAITFGHPLDHHYESTLPLQADPLWDLYFAQVATGQVGGIEWVSGLAVVNPSPTTAAQVTITVHKSDGSVNGSPVTRTLAPGEKYVRELIGIEGIGALDNQASGYVHLHADQPIFAFELFYNRALDFISAVAAQR